MESQKRVAIYVRVSTQDQSVDMQTKELVEYSQRRGWQIFKIFEEVASGTKDTRPVFIEMQKAAHQRKFDILLVWKLDRLARSLKHLITVLHDLNDLRVEFISFKDNVDLSSSSGRLLTHLLGAFAEFEADLIKARVNAGLANARKKGKRLGRPPSINRSEVVRLRAEGLSLTAIALKVNCTKGAVSKTLKKMGFQMPENTKLRKEDLAVEDTEVSETVPCLPRGIS